MSSVHVSADQVWFGLLVLRVSVGVTMIAHGYNHIYRGGKIKGTAGWFASLGMKPGILHAWLASLTELAAGAALVVGSAHAVGRRRDRRRRSASRSSRTTARPGSSCSGGPTEGWEYLMNLIAACVAIGCLGPGRWSLDNAVDFQLHGWCGLIVALVIGVGGAAALLAVFWRPPAPAPSS